MGFHVLFIVAGIVCGASGQGPLLVDSPRNVVLSWSVGNGSLTMSVSMDAGGWVGVAFSPDGNMVGSHAIIGWPSGVSGNIQEYWLQSQQPNGVVPVSDPILTGASITVSGATMTMNFTRPLEYLGRPITLSGMQTMLWAMNMQTRGLVRHDFRGAFQIDLSSGVSAATSARTQLIAAHGVLMWFAFCVCFPLGAMSARYLTHSNLRWFHAHRVLQVTGTLLMLVAFALAISYVQQAAGSHFATSHPLAGLCTIVCMFVNFLAGLSRPHKESPWRRSWFLFHSTIGRCAFIWGPLMALSGILTYQSLFGDSILPLLYVYVVVTPIIVLIAITRETLRSRATRPSGVATPL